MNYEELSLSGFIKEVVDVSAGPHPRKFCFVLGAGASRSSGIKSGQELVNIWDKELEERNPREYQRWKEELGITDDNKYGFYSHYYEKRFFRQPSDGYNYLEKLMEHAKPSTGYVMLSYLLTKPPYNLAVTTNFDHLIEDAVNYYQQIIPLVIGHEALAHYISGRAARPTIVKIHRDLLLDPKNRSGELEQLHQNWETALAAVFAEYHPIFIGYAGNDNSLMGFLIRNSSHFQDGSWRFPYWMLYRSDPLDGKILTFLQQAGGYFIRHEGFDKTLYLLGAALGYKMPPRESFLSDAEKRFQMLADAIDAFTEELSNEKDRPISNFDTGDDKITDIGQAILQVTDTSQEQAMYGEAMKLYNKHDFKQAVPILRDLVRMAPQNAKYHAALARALHFSGNSQEALPVMRRAIALDPGQARYYDNLADILKNLDDYDDALPAAQKAVELEPGNAFYHNRLGIVLDSMGRYDEALRSTQSAIEIDPDHPFFRSCLADILKSMERLDEALRAAQKAVELDPHDAYYRYILGKVWEAMGLRDKAIGELRTATDLDPNDPFYHYYLGTLFRETGNRESARKSFQKAVELDPKDELYSNALNRLLRQPDPAPQA